MRHDAEINIWVIIIIIKHNKQNSNQPDRLLFFWMLQKGDIVSLSRRDRERSTNCAARGSRRSSLLQIRD